MAYQFIHMETYSRKGRDGQSVDFILAEAERRSDASTHVAVPAKPELVFGIDVDGVRRLHDERALAAKAPLANGKQRAIRKDQNTLLTIIASHPAAMDAFRYDATVARQVRDWETLTVEWLREQYGDQLASVVRHTDEAHPHLHAFILPDGEDMRAGWLHPGQSAKAEIVAVGPSPGEDAKAVNRRGDRAYRAAMRGWQDSYWERVGLPCGLARLGPGRRRLTRGDWQAEQKQAQTVRAARERVAELHADGKTFIANTRNKADEIRHKARDEAARLHANAVEKQKAATRLHDVAIARLAAARTILNDAKKEGRGILAVAREKAERLRSFGTGLRSLWDGLRHSKVETRILQSVANNIAAERRRADDAQSEAIGERRKRREAEQGRERALAALTSVGRQRDDAWRQLAVHRPDTPQPEHIYGARR